MGDIINNMKRASNGNPYKGDEGKKADIKGSSDRSKNNPPILRHSLDGNMNSNPLVLNENVELLD